MILRIIEQALIVSQFRLGHGQLALGRLQSRLAGIYLRRCRQILPLCVIHFLLRDNSGLALKDSIQTRILQVKRLVLRLIPVQLVLRAADLIHRILDFRLIFLKLRLQLWNLQDRHYLAGLYVGSVVDKQLFDVTGFLRVHINLLEGHQFGGQCDLLGQATFSPLLLRPP